MKTPRQPDRLGWWAGALLTCLSLGCAPSSQPSPELQASLTEMAKKQDELLAANKALTAKNDEALTKLGALDEKLTALDKKVAAGGGGAKKPRGPQPGRPDPKATYKVAVFDGDAQMGPDNAKVTIVEWSDFQ